MFPQFANPAFLLLTLVVPLLLWCHWRLRRGAVRHSLAGLLGSLPRTRRWLPWAGAFLRGLSLSLLVVALAGPYWPKPDVTTVQKKGIAVMMLVDVSGSMEEPDFDWHGQPISRLDAVKRVFRLFVLGGAARETADGTDASPIDGRPDDLIGMVVFASRPDDVCPLTLQHSQLMALLDKEKPRTVPGESMTNISDAVALGLKRLTAAGPRRKVIVLLTDGEHNVDKPESKWTPRQAAHVVAAHGIPIYVIDAGGKPSNREPGAETASAKTREEAKRTLEDMAKITHGQYFEARDTPSLIEACLEIDKLQTDSVESVHIKHFVRPVEFYPWCALGASVCWMLAVSLEWTWWRRSP